MTIQTISEVVLSGPISDFDLIENIVQGVVVFGPDRRLHAWNREYERMLETPPGFLKVGLESEELLRFLARRGDYGEGDPETLSEQRSERLWQAPGRHEKTQYRSRDGRLYDVLFRGREGGGLVMTYTDVTERERSEDAYREGERKLLQILDNSPYGASIVGRHSGRRLFVNTRFCEMHGVDEDTLLNADLARTYVDESDLDKQWDYIDRYGAFSGFEVRRYRVSGEQREIWWCLTDARLLSFGGEEAILVWHHDVTEFKRNETALREALAEIDRSHRTLEQTVEARTRQLHEAMERAEAANRSMGDFLANMSHELRTPLNAIQGFAQMIAGGMLGPLQPKYREYGADISASAGHLSSIIADILDISKVEAGEVDVRPELIDLTRLFADCERMVRERAETAEVALTFAHGKDMPGLLADPLRLKQILLNLVGNAIKFTPRGGIVSVATEADAGGGVAIEVRDTGIGIARDDIPKVLEKFGQVRGSAMNTHEGAGLGLALSKSLIERHGGRLELESEPGQGTCIRLLFPPVPENEGVAGRDAVGEP